MGVTQVTAAVRNPARPRKSWEGVFLVDTGALDCLVPGKHLKALGLKPRGKRAYELADGSEVTMDITVAEVEFMDEIVGATVIFGPDEAEPILGVTALESAGIEIDPRTQRPKRLPAVRLKAAAHGARRHRVTRARARRREPRSRDARRRAVEVCRAHRPPRRARQLDIERARQLEDV